MNHLLVTSQAGPCTVQSVCHVLCMLCCACCALLAVRLACCAPCLLCFAWHALPAVLCLACLACRALPGMPCLLCFACCVRHLQRYSAFHCTPDLHVSEAFSTSQVKKAVAVLELPANPLDSLIDLLGGPDCVAEMTGRKARLVRQQGGGQGGAKGGVKWEPRNASGVGAKATLDLINVHERQMFLDLEKRVAVISEAASAGISLHADRCCCCLQEPLLIAMTSDNR